MFEDSSADRVIAILRAAATRGVPGSRLPTVRELMAEHGVSPGTVQRALTALAREGLIDTRPGDGTYIAARRGALRLRIWPGSRSHSAAVRSTPAR